MAVGDLIKVEDADFKWDNAPTKPEAGNYIWNLVFEIAGPSGGLDVQALQQLEKKKKKGIA